jgi:hypothetical protein
MRPAGSWVVIVHAVYSKRSHERAPGAPVRQRAPRGAAPLGQVVEILIEASLEVVWGVITEPEQVCRWFSDEADVEGRAGADGTLTWKPGGRGGDREFDVVAPGGATR